MKGDWMSEAVEYRAVDLAAQEAAGLAMSEAQAAPSPDGSDGGETLASVNSGLVEEATGVCPSCGGAVARKRSGKKAKVYCSDRCQYKAWTAAEPRVRRVPGQAPSPGPTRGPEESRSAAVRRAILALPAYWREPSDYCRELGMTWASIQSRLRELRMAKYGGHNVERSFRGIRNGTKVYVYKIGG